MNILLLGNGFDLYHNLPTKYINFINTVNFLKDNFDENEMNTIGKVFNDERLYSVDYGIKNSYEKYYSIYSRFPLDTNSIKQLVEYAKNNTWFTYLSRIAEKIDTWIDFEKEIGSVVEAFEKFFEKNTRKEIYFTHLSHNDSEIIRMFKFFYSEFRDEGLGGKNYEVNDEFLVCLTLSNAPVINKKKIIDTLYNQLEYLSHMLKLYLQCFVENVLDKISESGLYNTHNIFSNATHIFTLNYTNTFEKLYWGDGKKKICHLHGIVGDDIVLGVNSDEFDELEKLNTDFICFKKYYQRVYYKTDLKYLSTVKTINNIDKRIDHQLTVMGHSLDITDKEIITTLFEYASKITIFCHDRKVIGDYIKNLISIYGKKGFDDLRISKDLTFSLLEE